MLLVLLCVSMLISSKTFVLKYGAAFNSGMKAARQMSVKFSKIEYLEQQLYSKMKNLPLKTLKPRIILSVSGGSDSMAMLLLFHSIRNRLDMDLEVLNFNHKIRFESFEEAQYIQSVCSNFDMPFRCIEAKDHQFVNAGQDDFRNWRRQCYEEIISSCRDSRTLIATAHTANDQTETVLMKLLRGTHISNIQGMNLLEGFYLRPLLDIPKQKLVEYLRNNKTEWREDASNADIKYRRNLVRLETIPSLERACGGESALQSRLLNLAEQSNDVNEWVLREVAALMPFVDHYEYPTDEYPHMMDFSRVTSDKEHLLHNPIVMGHVVNTWLTRLTKECISYENIKRMTVMLSEASKGGAGAVHRRKGVSCRGFHVAVMDRQLRLQWMTEGIGSNKDENSHSAGKLKGEQQSVVWSPEGGGQSVKVVFPPYLHVDIAAEAVVPTRVANSVASAARSNSGNGEDGDVNRGHRGPYSVSLPLSCLLRGSTDNTAVVRVRFPQEGDVFHPGWRGVTTRPLTVSGLLREEGVPFAFRDRVLLVTLEQEQQQQQLTAVEGQAKKSEILAIVLNSGKILSARDCGPDEVTDRVRLTLAWKRK